MTSQNRTERSRSAICGLVALGLTLFLTACNSQQNQQANADRGAIELAQSSPENDVPTVVVSAKRDKG